MPITILDYVKAVAGDKEMYTAHDFTGNGVQIFGGCESCPTTLGAYNAYPSKSGYWRCADCIGDTGFGTVEEFKESLANTRIACPRCGEATNINERQVTNDHTEETEYVFECGDCGYWWP
jgi:ribosomal protein S27AE